MIVYPRLRTFLLILVLALLGAAAGWYAGPALSRNHYLVEVAERVAWEEATGTEERTDQSTAIRDLGIPLQQLYADARVARDRFALGSAVFGAWCGLALAIHIAGVIAFRRRREYVTDRGRCVSCGRCFEACPIEHRRRRHLGEEAAMSAGDSPSRSQMPSGSRRP